MFERISAIKGGPDPASHLSRYGNVAVATLPIRHPEALIIFRNLTRHTHHPSFTPRKQNTMPL